MFKVSKKDVIYRWLYYLQCSNIRKKDLEQFILSLRKDAICCENSDLWDLYNETSLLPTEKYFSKLKNKGITDREYKHV